MSTPYPFPVVLFDDGQADLSPVTDLRAALDVRTGALTTRERTAARLGLAAVFVPTALAALTAEADPNTPVNDAAHLKGTVLALSARAPLAHRLAAPGALQPGQALTDPASGAVLAALVDASRLPALAAGDRSAAAATPFTPARPADRTGFLMTRPWHVRTVRDACLADDLDLLCPLLATRWGAPHLPPTAVRLGQHAVVVAPSAAVGPLTVLDASGGPILIHDHAAVRPGAILIGPCFVGEHSTVLERATIRPQTAIGPWCKVNGEVGGAVFQGLANKAHDGYLGDSYLGQWVNLGAGTTTSNLLNTYGEIIAKASPAARNERTGETFLGSIVGDHVKTAICTRLMTGTVVGTGAMIATTAPASGCVPAFSWNTDEGRQPYRLDKFTDVARAAMARRGQAPSEALLTRLAALHAAALATPR